MCLLLWHIIFLLFLLLHCELEKVWNDDDDDADGDDVDEDDSNNNKIRVDKSLHPHNNKSCYKQRLETLR